ncbi:MAG: L,D-transpeptidase [Gemmatimonadetes bacterium]|nr:L,D-transpeptidase [Gemmatimonadota bacterium]
MTKHFRGAVLTAFATGMLVGGGGAATQAAAAERAPVAAPTDGFSVTVDLSDRMLYVSRRGETVREYRVAVGQRRHPTPTGSYNVRRLIWNPRWVPPDADWAREKRAREPGDPRNPMGRVKIFFRAPDYYIHGTRETDSLGRAESHGCIRMRNADVIELARMVMENGGERRSAGWFQRVINRVSNTQDVRLSRPVPLRVRA